MTRGFKIYLVRKINYDYEDMNTGYLKVERSLGKYSPRSTLHGYPRGWGLLIAGLVTRTKFQNMRVGSPDRTEREQEDINPECFDTVSKFAFDIVRN